MTTRRKPTPGTVSHGTMRPEDLIPAFLNVAEAHRLSRANRAQVREIRSRVNQTETTATRPAYDYNTEEADEDTDALFDILDTIAPAGHYFGAHPGDGCDYGFWQNEEN